MLKSHQDFILFCVIWNIKQKASVIKDTKTRFLKNGKFKQATCRFYSLSVPACTCVLRKTYRPYQTCLRARVLTYWCCAPSGRKNYSKMVSKLSGPIQRSPPPMPHNYSQQEIHTLKSYPQVPWNVTVFEDRVFIEVIKVRSPAFALIQYDWCPYKNRTIWIKIQTEGS